MRKLAVVLLIALPLFADTESDLRRLTQEQLDAIAPGHADVWRRNLHDNFVHVDENNVVRGKEEILKELTPLPAGLAGKLAIAKFQVKVTGDVAVATHEDLENLDYHGQQLVSRWRSTDTWLRTPAGWKLLAQQTTALLEDPPAMKMPNEQLCTYNGTYRLTREIAETLSCADGRLLGNRTDRPEATYQAEVTDVFFAPGRPRTRRIFLRDDRGEITGFVDRREGIDIRWTKVRSEE